MNPGNDAAAYGGDLQLGGLGRRTAYPFLFAGQVPENSFGQRDRRSARSILFLRVMGFFDRHVVFRKTLHQFGQSAVHREKHVDADTVIRSVEERALPLVAQLFDFGVPVEPSGRTAHHRHAGFQAGYDVLKSGMGSGEFDSDIRFPKVFGIQIAGVVDVDNQRNGMAPGDQDLFDFLSHLAVAYQCNLHNTYECFRKFTLIFK